jgi:hypothetical protein
VAGALFNPISARKCTQPHLDLDWDLDVDLNWRSSNSRNRRKPPDSSSPPSGCSRKCAGDENVPIEVHVEAQG